MRACEDGWLPRKLAVKNKKYGSAHYILLVFYLIGTVPILIGLDLNTVANSTVILFTIIRGVIAYSAMQLPKKLPDLWNKSSFHVSNGKLKAVCTFSIALAALSVIVLLISTSMVQIIGNIAILAFSIAVALLVNKRVTLNPSFTENSR